MRLRSVGLFLLLVVVAVLALSPSAGAKVVNENTDDLPPGCDSISEELELTVRGGKDFASDMAGVVFTFDNRSFDMPACARVTVTFVNEDDVRHQFMPHGVWPDGTFLIEVDGPGEDTGTFITSANPGSVMVHCGVSQHQQKGMKAQILVAGGTGNIPNIPGVAGLPPEDGQEEHSPTTSAWIAVVLVALAMLFPARLRRPKD